MTFRLKQESQILNVRYDGIEPLPDTFRDGAQALAEGKMGPDGVFHAAKIQAKCASKYEAKPGAKPGSKPYPGTQTPASPNKDGNLASNGRAFMENIGALAMMLAFCLAVYAVLGSLVGKWKKRPFLIAERRARGLFGVGAAHAGRGDPGLRADHGRLPPGLRAAHTQPRRCRALQVRGMVGRAGRLAAALDLVLSTYAAVVVFRTGASSAT